jgi:hypothetical protein
MERRKPFLSFEGQAAVMADFEYTKTTKSKASIEDIEASCIKHHKAENNLGPLAADPVPSRHQIYRLQQQMFPETDDNPAITNARREEALGDPYNAISNIAIASAIMDPTEARPNGRFHPSCIANFDAMSVVLGRPQGNKKVYMKRGTKAMMQTLGRSCSRASRPGERKQRSIKLIACGAANGDMRCAIHIMKQRTCLRFEIFNLGQLSLNCIHYLAIQPARPVKKDLQILLSEERRLASLEIASAIAVATPSVTSAIPAIDTAEHLHGSEELEEDEDENEFHEGFAGEQDYGDDDEADAEEDPRFPSDASMTLAFLQQCIIPNVISARARLQETIRLLEIGVPPLSATELSTLKAEAESVLITCDGDYPQIEIILGKLIAFGEANKVEYWKHACSWMQPVAASNGSCQRFLAMAYDYAAASSSRYC